MTTRLALFVLSDLTSVFTLIFAPSASEIPTRVSKTLPGTQVVCPPDGEGQMCPEGRQHASHHDRSEL